MMTRKKWLLGGIAGLGIAGLAGLALAQQQLFSNTLTGNEVFVASVGGPGGSGLFVSTAQIRNATGYQLQSQTSGTVQANTLAARYIWTATVSGALTLNAPATPWDGQLLEVVNGSGSNFTATVTLAPAAGQAVLGNTVATLAANTSAEWQFAQSTGTWVRVR